PRRGTGMRYGGRIAGATVVGPRAADTLQEAVVAMQTGAFTGRLAQAMHPYPSWGQALQMAALRIVQNEGVLEDVGQ
ncbi:MAG: NAD(P)/FAD-dependent oxidoreductase, partial [Acidimicrobiales bacterium]